MTTNPYQTPGAPVSDVAEAVHDGQFVPAGQRVPAGHGWHWFRMAWAMFKAQPGVWLGVTVLLFVLAIAISIVPVAGTLAMTLLGPVFWGGIMLGADAQRRGAGLEIGHLFAGFRQHTGRLVGLGAVSLLAYLAMFAVILLIFGATMAGALSGMEQPTPEEAQAMAGVGMLLAFLVIVALTIPVQMALFFASALVAINGVGVGAALRVSFMACLRNILPFLVWGLVGLVLMLLATLPLLLGWIVLAPVMLAAWYAVYRDVFYRG